MRRDYFSLEVRNVDWVNSNAEPARPTVTIDFEGPADPLQERLTDDTGSYLGSEDIDVAYRLQDPVDAADARGVVGLPRRLTGDFVLELNERADNVFDFLAAARRFGESRAAEDGEYAVEVDTGDRTITFRKQTFLVYDEEGNLLRNHSLIPSGVEL